MMKMVAAEAVTTTIIKIFVIAAITLNSGCTTFKRVLSKNSYISNISSRHIENKAFILGEINFIEILKTSKAPEVSGYKKIANNTYWKNLENSFILDFYSEKFSKHYYYENENEKVYFELPEGEYILTKIILKNEDGFIEIFPIKKKYSLKALDYSIGRLDFFIESTFEFVKAYNEVKLKTFNISPSIVQYINDKINYKSSNLNKYFAKNLQIDVNFKYNSTAGDIIEDE